MRSASLAPATGVLFVLLVIPSFLLMPYPPEAVDSTADEIAAHFADNEDGIVAGAFLSVLAMVALVFFAAVARRRMVEAGAEASATAMFGGALTYAIAASIDATLNFAAADAVDELDPGVIQTISTVITYNFFPYALGGVVFLIGFGAAVIRHGTLPTWMGWVAIAATPLAISPLYFVGAAIAALLIVAASVTYMREAPAAA